MMPISNPMVDELEVICERGVLDSFAGFVRARAVPNDACLAELIELDARSMLANGRMVELDRYLEAVPNLGEMPISLDAAIEFTLRSWTMASKPGDDPVRRLEGLYPSFSRSIRNSAALTEGLVKTQAIADPGLIDRRMARNLPRGFGPVLRDGVSRYELRRVLGEGSQGVVYLAVDRALSDSGNEALVAIKVLDARASSEGDRWRRMDEATKARRIEHDNVVRVLDRGWADDNEYIIYENIAGGDLDRWLHEQGGASAKQCAEIVQKLALGVQAAHAAGLVHRDLKPGNVLMATGSDKRGFEPKITDFGVAERAGPREDSDESRPRVGNIAFIAPEQYRCEDAGWSAPVDVYALGGILFHLLTGRLPNGSSAAEIAATHDPVSGRSEAPLLAGAASGTDRDLEAICRKALAPRAADRYLSADALAADLGRWLAQKPIEWLRPSLSRRARLLTRRQPRLVAMTSFACLAIIVGAATTFSVWVYASAWASAERAARASAGKYLQDASNAISKGQQADVAGNWFPALNALESIIGPYVFDPRKVGKDPKNAKFRMAISAIRAAQNSKLDNSLEALLWSDTLSFWLLKAGDFDRAEALLAKNDPAWHRILIQDDPWRMYRATLHAAAKAERLLAKFNSGGTVDATDELVVTIEQSLRESERKLAADHYGDTLHRFVLGCLVQLYDKGALDKPEGLRWAESQVEQIRKDLLLDRNGWPAIDDDFSSSKP